MYLTVTQHRQRVKEYEDRLNAGEPAEEIAKSLGKKLNRLYSDICYSRRVLNIPGVRRKYTQEELDLIQDLRDKGANYKYIARVMNDTFPTHDPVKPSQLMSLMCRIKE